MKTLQYSFAQIEAFATIAETGSLSQAAIRLAKDRTTLRDLLDYLEDALGYRLFSREGRSLTLTAEGEQLFRQAHLLLRQAQAFESFAQTLPQTAGQALRLVYDPFVPREFLCALADNLARRQIRLSCWSASRREAEQALSDGVAGARHRGSAFLRGGQPVPRRSAAADAIESFVDAAVSDAPAQ